MSIPNRLESVKHAEGKVEEARAALAALAEDPEFVNALATATQEVETTGRAYREITAARRNAYIEIGKRLGVFARAFEPDSASSFLAPTYSVEFEAAVEKWLGMRIEWVRELGVSVDPLLLSIADQCIEADPAYPAYSDLSRKAEEPGRRYALARERERGLRDRLRAAEGDLHRLEAELERARRKYEGAVRKQQRLKRSIPLPAAVEAAKAQIQVKVDGYFKTHVLEGFEWPPKTA